jgi:hypothetical protein
MTVSNSRSQAAEDADNGTSSRRPTFEEQVAKLPVPPLPTTQQLEGRIPGIRFVDYPDESQLEAVMNLVGRDLSEPYSSTCAGVARRGRRLLFGMPFLLMIP